MSVVREDVLTRQLSFPQALIEQGISKDACSQAPDPRVLHEIKIEAQKEVSLKKAMRMN